MPPVGFEPTILAGERPQTYALDRAATGTGIYCLKCLNITGNFIELWNSTVHKRHAISCRWTLGQSVKTS